MSTSANRSAARIANARSLLVPVTAVTMLLCAAIFGFFYAWAVSTLWGLDRIDPRVAIEAMNAMNEAVRNAAFAPAFFGTPVALAITTLLCFRAGRNDAAAWFGAAAVLYLAGALAVTGSVNVPMNRAMIDAGVPETLQEAEQVWGAYSERWQFYNALRMCVSAVVFLMAVMGTVRLAQRSGQ
ncbi:DUF1772 domain-containing protein [Primorskyibacter aestuariivivens]|uniref:anthrone oxygenase family protein n=1 Tax=Primorskyibacter aestuariivivens TaxID=1888912 RepID=UPI0023008511|nr:anthrone oxygenase family protein [Primorskyibacter aestuariivivens]MDA7427519.1 DUF1772 domain-containing protein [Primorskyibacter aestuariivivens]